MCCRFTGSVFYGVRTAPYWKYVWNEYLLKRVCSDLHSDWLLYIIHGFIGQSSILSVCLLFDEIVTSWFCQYCQHEYCACMIDMHVYAMHAMFLSCLCFVFYKF